MAPSLLMFLLYYKGYKSVYVLRGIDWGGVPKLSLAYEKGASAGNPPLELQAAWPAAGAH